MSSASPGTSGVVSFKADILPLFRPQDISCMSGKGVILDSYEYMSEPDNAQEVYDHLTGATPPRMPLGGPFWSAEQLDLFHRWMTETPPLQP
jgi:hypothetical protein